MYLTLWSGIGLVSRLTMVVILVVTLTVTSVSYIVVGYWFGE